MGEEDALAPARGVFIGLILAVLVWGVILALVYELWR